MTMELWPTTSVASPESQTRTFVAIGSNELGLGQWLPASLTSVPLSNSDQPEKAKYDPQPIT